MRGMLLFSPEAMNEAFKIGFDSLVWKQRRYSFWETDEENVMRAVYCLPTEEQKETMSAAGH